VAVPLYLDTDYAVASAQPVTLGLPFPKGTLREVGNVALLASAETTLPVQTAPLARWSDGSIKWLLLDFIVQALREGHSKWWFEPGAACSAHTQRLRLQESQHALTIDTGTARFRVDRRKGLEGTRVLLTDRWGKVCCPRIDEAVIETRDPVRTTIRLVGAFPDHVPCRFVARLCFFAGTGLARMRLTLHNPQRARHRGGLWDLGDPGSIFFRDLSIEATVPEGASVLWSAEAGQSRRASAEVGLEIYQDSSGGENWRSQNHVNHQGQVPCTFRGYRVRTGGKEETGLRASPVVGLSGPAGGVVAAVPDFWQQFPKAIEAEPGLLRVRLFPGQFGDLFELQGGEQKTYTVWLHFGTGDDTSVLDWVHHPIIARADPEWYCASEAIPCIAPAREGSQLEAFLQDALQGSRSFFARREVIDEYGWRNYGEIFADHEAAYYEGAGPVISHYNNQYDMVLGALLQYFRTGERCWFELLDPLARHVIDIDIYHTDQDKAAYNGGLFWFTDHYLTAATSTHRCYSRANCASGDISYGGGPGSAHNFTTGLLHYYYLTGDLNAADAVLGLADWVVNMDDGSRNILGVLDDLPTGLASAGPGDDYQGPDRSAGLSINALLDGWLLSGRAHYLDKAEELIRRCIHPRDDVAARNLLDVEFRWSYTVFLSSLARYVSLKAETGKLDFMYAYAQASLLHYAGWMLANEVAYFEQREKLKYPTEAWAAQDFRKANVLRHAAAHAGEPLRSRLLQRGEELADRAWRDLGQFETRTVARAIAILMVEGTLDSFCRSQPIPSAPSVVDPPDFGWPVRFVPQKQRVRAQFRTVPGLLGAVYHLANPRRWWRYIGPRGR